jgi:DNA-directed RNA polymerase subunit RPC12/RpoP
MAQLVSSYRCSNCNLNWPMHEDYRRCPKCEGKCWLNKTDPDFMISQAEVQSYMRQIAFEKFCAKRDARVMREHLDALSSKDTLYPDAIIG